MGGHAYWYLVPYQDDRQKALDELRAREFAAGRYHPVISFIKFTEPAFSAQKPGAKHKTIRAAVKASAEDGTRSILDIDGFSERADYGKAAPLGPGRVRELYGTDQPTRDMVLDRGQLAESVSRGQCVYTIVYAGGAPSELFFFGYSYD
ncbi:MAG: hypothetical protein JWP01_4121 [Myxococcales bacterium]|nr:hypothetical protein [Myxococcales bacterium]